MEKSGVTASQSRANWPTFLISNVIFPSHETELFRVSATQDTNEFSLQIEKKSTQQQWSISISGLEDYGPKGIPIEVVLEIMKKALKSLVWDPSSELKAVAVSSDVKVDFMMTKSKTILILTISFSGFPVEYRFPLNPVKREPIDVVNARVHDVQDDLNVLKIQVGDIQTLIPIMILRTSDTSHTAIENRFTVAWNESVFLSKSADKSFHLSDDKRTIRILNDGLYRISTKISTACSHSLYIGIYINFELKSLTCNSCHNSVNISTVLDEMFPLKSDDHIIIAFQNVNGANTISGSANDNYFSIQKIM